MNVIWKFLYVFIACVQWHVITYTLVPFRNWSRRHSHFYHTWNVWSRLTNHRKDRKLLLATAIDCGSRVKAVKATIHSSNWIELNVSVNSLNQNCSFLNRYSYAWQQYKCFYKRNPNEPKSESNCIFRNDQRKTHYVGCSEQRTSHLSSE
jgi:hypothetical protein